MRDSEPGAPVPYTLTAKAEAVLAREPVTLAQAVGEWAAAHHPAGPGGEPEPGEYDPGPEADDEGGMSEYRHYADWAEVDRAEYEREAAL